MAFDETNGNGMVMPVAPMNNYGNGGFGGFGGDWAWIIILLLAFNGGFGGWGGMGGWGAMGLMDGGFGLYPWLNNSQNINGGFRDQMLNTTLTGIQNSVTSGFGDVQTALCGGFAGVNATVNSAQNNISNLLYTNQMADMNRSFALQTQLSQCCCDNKSGLADLKYTVATENCADRTAAQQNTRDIIESQTRSTQAILDKLCALELDAKNDTIGQLRQELLYSRGQASQIDQTARLLAGQANEVDALYTRLSSCPIPTVPVYGRQPIFQCGSNTGCGCGCGVA